MNVINARRGLFEFFDDDAPAMSPAQAVLFLTFVYAFLGR